MDIQLEHDNWNELTHIKLILKTQVPELFRDARDARAQGKAHVRTQQGGGTCKPGRAASEETKRADILVSDSL